LSDLFSSHIPTDTITPPIVTKTNANPGWDDKNENRKSTFYGLWVVVSILNLILGIFLIVSDFRHAKKHSYY
jgi:uncharacterized membrane protein